MVVVRQTKRSHRRSPLGARQAGGVVNPVGWIVFHGDNLGELPLVDHYGNVIVCATREDAEALAASVLNPATQRSYAKLVRWNKPRTKKETAT
jgi:hypothetical protein